MMKLPGPIQEMADRLNDLDKEEQLEPSPPQGEDWKKRFTNYKSSTDSTIHDLRQQLARKDSDLAELRLAVETMQNELAEVRKRSPEPLVPSGVLSDDDMESLGEDNVQRMARIAKAQIERERRELDARLNQIAEKQRRQEEIERQKSVEQANMSFWDKVRQIVPDVDDIDQKDEFSDFLNSIEEYSGKRWRDIGKQAHANGDVARMADIYKQFAKSQGAPVRDVSPVGTAAAPARSSDGKKIWTKAEYEQAVARQYRGGPLTAEKEANIEKLHKAYYQALKEGRVRG